MFHRNKPSIVWWMSILPKHALQIGHQRGSENASLAVYSVINQMGYQRHKVFHVSLQENLENLLGWYLLLGIKQLNY